MKQITVSEIIKQLISFGIINKLEAIWFWQANGVGAAARADNITKVSIAINGSTIGLEERLELTEKYKKELGV